MGPIAAETPVGTQHVPMTQGAAKMDLDMVQDDIVQEYVVSEDERDEQFVSAPVPVDLPTGLHTRNKFCIGKKAGKQVTNHRKDSTFPVQSRGVSKKGRTAKSEVKIRSGSRNKHGR